MCITFRFNKMCSIEKAPNWIKTEPHKLLIHVAVYRLLGTPYEKFWSFSFHNLIDLVWEFNFYIWLAYNIWVRIRGHKLCVSKFLIKRITFIYMITWVDSRNQKKKNLNRLPLHSCVVGFSFIISSDYASRFTSLFGGRSNLTSIPSKSYRDYDRLFPPFDINLHSKLKGEANRREYEVNNYPFFGQIKNHV